jgi:hypothetical protein
VGGDGLRVRLPSGGAGPGKAVLQHVALLTGTALTQVRPTTLHNTQSHDTVALLS